MCSKMDSMDKLLFCLERNGISETGRNGITKKSNHKNTNQKNKLTICKIHVTIQNTNGSFISKGYRKNILFLPRGRIFPHILRSYPFE